MQKYELVISPCPNDCYVFHGMIDGVCGDVSGVEYCDIEELNHRILAGAPALPTIIKGSVAIAGRAVDLGYEVLRVGAALGRGNGPVVVRRGSGGVSKSAHKKVALPGANTTAALLFARYFAGYEPVCMPFYEVAGAVQNGMVECGILIHEGRFTYRELGLELIADLGEKWDAETQMPLPLGLIYAGGGACREEAEKHILQSIQHAQKNQPKVVEFAKKHAQELSAEVLNAHIDYFVNDYTVEIGADGAKAINLLLGHEIIAR